MEEFIKGKIYYFDGHQTLIEGNVMEIKYLNDKYIYLGKFIEYIGFPQGSDWLNDAKAKFEFGILSKGYYDKIKPLH
jgi:hypothetical protein